MCHLNGPSGFLFPACGENPSPGNSLPALAILSLNNCQLSFLAERLGLYSPFPKRSRLTNTQKTSPVCESCVCVFTLTSIIPLHQNYQGEVSVFIQLKTGDTKSRTHQSQQKHSKIFFFNLRNVDFLFCCSTKPKQSCRFHRGTTECENQAYY